MTSRNDGFPVMAPAESLPGRRRLMGVVAIVLGALGFTAGFGVFAAAAAIACGSFAYRGDGVSRLLGVIATVMGCASLLVALLPLLLTLV